jgi:hypothetical protein
MLLTIIVLSSSFLLLVSIYLFLGTPLINPDIDSNLIIPNLDFNLPYRSIFSFYIYIYIFILSLILSKLQAMKNTRLK